mgnify:FL=1
MPTALVSALKTTNAKYIDPYVPAGSSADAEFFIALNEVMPRLYHMGFWRDMLVVLAEQDVSKGVWLLPEDHSSSGVGYDSIISAILEDDPAPIYSMWHDYRRYGEPATTASATYKSHMRGFIDDGFSATKDPYADNPDALLSTPRRQYRVSPVDSTSKATLLLKRKYVHVDSTSDNVFVPHDKSILKHALLGKVAEDNADVQRAEYHWSIAQKLLDAELDSYRGSAKPVLQVSPNGAGGSIKGMY